MVYRFLGKLFWKGGLERADIIIIHRGAPDDRKAIPGSSVTEVKSGYITYKSRYNEETVIPLHRILEVRLDGRVAWKRN